MGAKETPELRAGQAAGQRVLTPRGRRTRERLVAAARDLFATVPFADARLTDITAAAGVSAGTFYTYFDDKEGIFREVADEVLAELSEAPRLAVGRSEAGEIEAISIALKAYFLACLRNTQVVRSMEQLTVSDEQISGSRRHVTIVGIKRAARWIESLQDRGVCDMGIDAWTTAMALHTMGIRVAYDHLLISGSEEEVDQLADAVTRVWARTVGLERAGGDSPPFSPEAS